MLDTLDVWDGHLAAHGAELMAARLELVAALAPGVEKAYQSLAPASRPAAIARLPRNRCRFPDPVRDKAAGRRD